MTSMLTHRGIARTARHPVVKDPAKTLEAGRRYLAGETIKQIAEHFGCGHETIRKILNTMGVVMRSKGPVLGSTARPVWAEPELRGPVVASTAEPPDMTWCRQCERRLRLDEAVNCSKPFCKAVDSVPASDSVEMAK